MGCEHVHQVKCAGKDGICLPDWSNTQYLYDINNPDLNKTTWWNCKSPSNNEFHPCMRYGAEKPATNPTQPAIGTKLSVFSCCDGKNPQKDAELSNPYSLIYSGQDGIGVTQKLATCPEIMTKYKKSPTSCINFGTDYDKGIPSDWNNKTWNAYVNRSDHPMRIYTKANCSSSGASAYIFPGTMDRLRNITTNGGNWGDSHNLMSVQLLDQGVYESGKNRLTCQDLFANAAVKTDNNWYELSPEYKEAFLKNVYDKTDTKLSCWDLMTFYQDGALQTGALKDQSISSTLNADFTNKFKDSINIESTVQNYCGSGTQMITNPLCNAWCKDNGPACKQYMSAQCQAWYNQNKKEIDKDPSMVQDATKQGYSCACFMPQEYYNTLMSNAVDTAKGLDTTGKDQLKSYFSQVQSGPPICWYPSCQNNSVVPEKPTCPDIVSCFNFTQLKNDGTIEGNVDINQVNSCQQTKGKDTNDPDDSKDKKRKKWIIIGVSVASGFLLLLILILIIIALK